MNNFSGCNWWTPLLKLLAYQSSLLTVTWINSRKGWTILWCRQLENRIVEVSIPIFRSWQVALCFRWIYSREDCDQNSRRIFFLKGSFYSAGLPNRLPGLLAQFGSSGTRRRWVNDSHSLWWILIGYWDPFVLGLLLTLMGWHLQLVLLVCQGRSSWVEHLKITKTWSYLQPQSILHPRTTSFV